MQKSFLNSILLGFNLSLCFLNTAQAKDKLSQDCKSILTNGTASFNFWYVSKSQEKVYFSKSENIKPSNRYIIPGDLVIAVAESKRAVYGCYIVHKTLKAHGWLLREKLKEIKNVKSLSPLTSKAGYSQMKLLSEDLPSPIKNEGHWIRNGKDIVEIWSQKNQSKIDFSGISGVVSTGDRSESSRDLWWVGALGQTFTPQSQIDDCDVLVLNFNNAILVSTGTSCFGSGHQGVYPDANGIYFKK